MGYKAVTISLTPNYHLLLKKYAKEEGMTVSGWITRKILERKEDEKCEESVSTSRSQENLLRR